MKLFLIISILVFSASAMDKGLEVTRFNMQKDRWNAQGNKGFFKLLAYFLGARNFEVDYQEFKNLSKDAEGLRQLGNEVEDPTCFHWDFLCTFVPHGTDRNW